MPFSVKGVNFDEQWNHIRVCLGAMLTMQGCEEVSASDFLSAVYKLCIANVPRSYAKELYDKLKEYLENHVKSVAGSLNSIDERDFLSKYVKEWNTFSLGIVVSNPLFKCLDGHWEKDKLYETAWGNDVTYDETEFYPYFQLAMITWKDCLFLQFGDRITRDVLDLVRKDREGELADHSIISGVIASTVEIGIEKKDKMEIYKKYIEDPYLVETERFYKKESGEFISTNGILNYLTKAITRVEEEEIRAKKYLEKISEKKAISVIDKALISDHSDKFLSEFHDILRQNKKEYMKKLLILLRRVPDTNSSSHSPPSVSSSGSSLNVTSSPPLPSFSAPVVSNSSQNSVSSLPTQQAGGLAPIIQEFTEFIKSFGMEYIERLNLNTETAATGSKTGSAATSKSKTAPNTEEKAENTATGEKEEKKENSKDKMDYLNYVDCLLEIYEKFNDLVTHTFLQHPGFVKALENGFTVIINENSFIIKSKNPNLSGQLLAQFIDHILRRSSVQKREEKEIENLLERCIQLFKFLSDKDIFQKYYSRYLAVRLIEDVSIGEEYEQLILNGLQFICGLDFTSKFQKMFQDMKIASSQNENFREFLEKRREAPPPSVDDVANEPQEDSDEKQTSGESLQKLLPASYKLSFEFSAFILTASAWPLTIEQNTFLTLPSILADAVLLFESFYHSSHNGRKLSWMHNSSKGELYAYLPSGNYQITMPTYMMCILLLFNQSDILDYKQIQNLTQLQANELNRIMKILVSHRILIPDHKKLSPTTRFKVNSHFKSKSLKIKLGGKIQTDKITQSTPDFTIDRKFILQAVIVRIMKMRKETTHNQLVSEVVECSSLQFVPSVALIKKTLEYLLDQEFIERAGDNKYRYLA